MDAPNVQACTFVGWQDYDWHESLQCNQNASGVKLHWNPAVYCIIAASHAITLFASLESVFRTFLAFKRWKTLYFW